MWLNREGSKIFLLENQWWVPIAYPTESLISSHPKPLNKTHPTLLLAHPDSMAPLLLFAQTVRLLHVFLLFFVSYLVQDDPIVTSFRLPL